MGPAGGHAPCTACSGVRRLSTHPCPLRRSAQCPTGLRDIERDMIDVGSFL